MHIVYTIILIVYVNDAYMEENEDQLVYAILLAVGVLYAALYEFFQMLRDGIFDYFGEF